MLTRTYLIALLALSLTACGPVTKVDPTGPAPAPSAKPATDCAALYDAYATWAKGCDGAALTSSLRAELVRRCEAHAALPGVLVSTAAFTSCAARIPLSTCAALPLDCLTPFDDGDHRFSRANEVYLGTTSYADYELFPRVQGTLGAGEGCDVHSQCTSGHCSSYDTCGSCIEYKAPGEACGANDVCTDWSACTAGVCVELGLPEGSPCQAPKGSSNCKQSLYCPAGTCVPRLALGDACDDGDFNQPCPRGAACHDSVCQTIVRTHEGEPCNDATALCGDEGTFCVDGLCRRPTSGIGEGGSCYIDVCAPGLVCSYGTCAIGAALGADCTGAVTCAPKLHCVYGDSGARCAAPAPLGGACSSSQDCDIDLYCDGTETPSVCRRAAGAGEACENGILCTSDLVCRAGVCSDLGLCSAP